MDHFIETSTSPTSTPCQNIWRAHGAPQNKVVDDRALQGTRQQNSFAEMSPPRRVRSQSLEGSNKRSSVARADGLATTMRTPRTLLYINVLGILRAIHHPRFTERRNWLVAAALILAVYRCSSGHSHSKVRTPRSILRHDNPTRYFPLSTSTSALDFSQSVFPPNGLSFRFLSPSKFWPSLPSPLSGSCIFRARSIPHMSEGENGKMRTYYGCHALAERLIWNSETL